MKHRPNNENEEYKNTKTILILAKSKKYGGTCLAGKDIETYQWVRPVLVEQKKGFTQEEFTKVGIKFEDFELEDLITMSFIKPTPLNFQPENELVNLNIPWKIHYEARASSSPLDDVDYPDAQRHNDSIKMSPKYFIDKNKTHLLESTSGSFLKYAIPSSYFIDNPASNSLQLIQLTADENHPKIYYIYKYSKWRPRIQFYYNNQEHDYPITDLNYRKLPTKPKGIDDGLSDSKETEAIMSTPEKCFVVISFASEFEGKHYKLAATVIIKEVKKL